MTKSDVLRTIASAGFPVDKKWNNQTLNFVAGIARRSMRDKIKPVIKSNTLGSLGNWAGPRDLFPTIEVSQKTAVVTITYLDICNRDRGQYGCTHEHSEIVSPDGQALRISGLTGLRNDRRRTGGRQKFCFFVFRGDSGHLYTHRSVASKGWLSCPPEKLLKRLRKLGIGASENVVQQGDFLLKSANGNAHADSEFAHERMGSGHHNFEFPVLYHRGQFKITEPTTLIHTAVDGIKHPDVIVPPGVYIVGTTAAQLDHSNMRD